MYRSAQRIAQLSFHLKTRTPIDKVRHLNILSIHTKMSHLYEDATPAEVKNAKVRPKIDFTYYENSQTDNTVSRVFI